MYVSFQRFFVALLVFTSGAAQATFHQMRINEVYSNADGSVQFVEMTAFSSGQQFIGGHSITTTTPNGQTKTFVFPSNLPGDTAVFDDGGGYYGGGATSYRSFLIGTAGFAALHIVTPDYIVPNGFLPVTNGTINYADVDIFSYAALPTTGNMSINRSGAAEVSSPTNFAGAMGVIPVSTPAALNYSDLWWGGTTENGWGMTVQQHGNTQFNIFFVYDGTGKPIWYAMPGGSWNSNFTVFSGGLAKPTSAPINAYDKTLFNPGVQVGTMAITYTSPTTATLNYTIGNASGTKQMQRQLFGPSDNTPGLQVGDMWWGGDAQNGWGVSITQQFRTLFAAWYAYDAAGNVTWLTLPGGSWNGNTYSGTLATATGSPWLGATYNPAQFAPAAVGTISLNFNDANNAVMSYTFTAGPYAGTTQTKTLVRQPY